MANRRPVCPPDDPWVTMVMYETHLEHVDPEEPLWRVPYFGQVVRSGTADENFAARKREHENDAAREEKDIGLHAVIDPFGRDALEWRIVSSQSGRRTAMQTLANAEEIRLIDEHGGVLRDMDKKLTQTLNLTKGGQGDARAVWAGIDARRRRKLTKFKAEMEAYVEEYGSALVSQAFVTAEKYPLGERLKGFRQGEMRKGLPEEEKINAWAQALPGWAWAAKQTTEYRDGCSKRGKEQAANETSEQKTARVDKTKATMATLASKTKRSKLSTEQWNNLSEFDRSERKKTLSKAHNRPEVLAKHVQDGKEQAANETPEQKTARMDKTKATMGTAASKVKRSNIMAKAHNRPEVLAKHVKFRKEQAASERRTDLQLARKHAVPFQKSKKRRAEMRKVSSLRGKKDNPVLYMVSEDGETIRRVQLDGVAGKRYTVGPVVDPEPSDAYDSD